MRQFLVVYDRKRGKLVGPVTPFSEQDRAAALRARFERELAEAARPDVEVVLLGAESLEDLQNTHARYFRSLEELAAAATPS